MLMILKGDNNDFVFETQTLPYQELQEQNQYRWSNQEPVGDRPLYQFIGPGEHSITLSGVLYPELTGGPFNLQKIRDMAATGESFVMVDGEGYNLGYWLIESVEQTSSAFFKDGIARKIEFTLSLKMESEGNPAGTIAGDSGSSNNTA